LFFGIKIFRKEFAIAVLFAPNNHYSLGGPGMVAKLRVGSGGLPK